MKSFERIFLYSTLIILIFYVFAVTNKIEGSVGICSTKYTKVFVKTSDYLEKMLEEQKYTYIIGLYEGIGLEIDEDWYLNFTEQMNPDQIQKSLKNT
ncbi:MAG: hypothetical protein R6V04_00875 [bacterium]